MANRIFFRSWITITCLLAGCAGTQPVTLPTAPNQPLEQVESLDGKGWWYARFRMDWPGDGEPNWYMDTLLAHQIVSPVLAKYRDHIDLWRFHRRAVHDSAGHRFSFIFFAKPAIANKIFHALKQNSILATLQKSGKIDKVSFDNTDKIGRPKVSDTSDPSWPNEIQKAWPSFIMGASQMWLDMIADIATDKEIQEAATIEQVYKDVQNNLTELWENNGQHVFFHHLSALYSYQPLLVIERKPMRF